MQHSLMSPGFFALSLATAILLAALAGRPRQLAFLAANLTFIGVILLGPVGALSTVVFCLLGYLLTRAVLSGSPRRFTLLVGFYVLVFAYLRKYGFWSWVLPESALTHTLNTIGLSFLFFKIVHVMIEAKSGTLGRLEFMTYVNYCLNFTTFMMGPIQRYQDYARQWHGELRLAPTTFDGHLAAARRVLLGLLKAYVVAEFLAPYALPSQFDPAGVSWTTLLVQIYAFYFYLYLNFAGYCDIVIGVGCLLGIRPPENFDKPFLAPNISEFWHRFHRSLTEWLTHYVFTPAYRWLLSSGARPLVALNLALVATMVVSGLWHGTTLNFLLFGLAHGVFFAAFRSWEAAKIGRFGKARVIAWRQQPARRAVGRLVTFNAVAFSLVFFRLDAGVVVGRWLAAAGRSAPVEELGRWVLNLTGGF
jgi:D-alanyl-lipoteichoic acid acyltransferase DltB (MBOAT superfamily)